jgi:hypothetical protein
MRRSRSGSGIGGLVLVGGVLYFTGAGTWVMDRVKGLDIDCYSAMSSIGGDSVANPVCGSVAKTAAAVDNMSKYAGDKVAVVRSMLTGTQHGLGKYVSVFADRAAQLSSSQERLQQMVKSGPLAGGQGSLAEEFQRAVDSFAIGQSYLNNQETAQLGLPWLEQSAKQPQGFGVMSQLLLGQMYANGNYGTPPDNRAAQLYLSQANQSIGVLMGSNSPQAQQLLGTLPIAPQAMQEQILRTLAELRIEGK